MQIIINHEYGSAKELKEIAKIAAEFEKEYSCNCTLKLNKSLNRIPLMNEIEGVSQALQSVVVDTLQASDKK